MLLTKSTIENGDIVVYQIESEKVPIVHRISGLQRVWEEDKDGKKVMRSKFLTKGDNNPVDDRGLYDRGQYYLDERNIIGHVYA